MRVSIVGVAAEVYVCKRTASETGGSYGVATSEAHLEELLLGHAPPPPAAPGDAGVELVRMGFPQRGAASAAAAVFAGPDCVLRSGCYTCPRCRAQVVELPCACHVCGLTLISSPHLARSYHHLFPVKPYEEVTAAALALARRGASGAQQAQSRLVSWAEAPGQLFCFGCLKLLASGGDDNASGGAKASISAAAASAKLAPGSSGAADGAGAAAEMILQCPLCCHVFCFDCDAFVHESLHNCPGCESMPGGLHQLEVLAL